MRAEAGECQQATPQEVIGTVSGAISMAPYIGSLIASMTAPVLVTALGPRGALFAIAPGVLLAAVVVSVDVRRRAGSTAVLPTRRHAPV